MFKTFPIGTAIDESRINALFVLERIDVDGSHKYDVYANVDGMTEPLAEYNNLKEAQIYLDKLVDELNKKLKKFPKGNAVDVSKIYAVHIYDKSRLKMVRAVINGGRIILNDFESMSEAQKYLNDFVTELNG